MESIKLNRNIVKSIVSLLSAAWFSVLSLRIDSMWGFTPYILRIHMNFSQYSTIQLYDSLRLDLLTSSSSIIFFLIMLDMGSMTKFNFCFKKVNRELIYKSKSFLNSVYDCILHHCILYSVHYNHAFSVSNFKVILYSCLSLKETNEWISKQWREMHTNVYNVQYMYRACLTSHIPVHWYIQHTSIKAGLGLTRFIRIERNEPN